MADFDAVVVGAGCAGSVAAYELARAGKSVLMIERGASAGAKNMTGGRIYTHSLAKVFPDFASEAPLERKITTERISFVTGDEATTVMFTSPRLGGESCSSYSVLRGPFDEWLASKAEEAGAECVYEITVEDVLKDESGRVVGVSAGGDEITAEVVILADGANSLLMEKAGMGTRPKPHQMAVSAKEVIGLSEQVVSDRFGASAGEGTAWLFAGDVTRGHAGGGFLYTNKDSVSLGIVATLSDLCTSSVPVYQMLEDFKKHPVVAPLIEGGKLLEYSGHLIPEGGYNMVPQLVADGCLAVGDAAMLCINLGYQVRGMDYAVESGALAARAALEALEAGDVSKAKLGAYKQLLEGGFVLKDLQAYRDFPAFMEGTHRMYGEYPEMLATMMRNMFTVDGAPVQPVRKKLMEPVRKVGIRNIIKDARKGVKAL